MGMSGLSGECFGLFLELKSKFGSGSGLLGRLYYFPVEWS